MKKKFIIISTVVVFFVTLLFLMTGRERTDVYVRDFIVSEDGRRMTLKVGVSSSTGYVRKIKRTSSSTNYYYTFYSTFGINSKIGAKDTFELALDDNVNEIYFYTGNKGYRLELMKSLDTQEWVKFNYAKNNTFKLKLIDKSDVEKIEISYRGRDDNYFDYTDKNTINVIYAILENLETQTVSKSFSPLEYEEIYTINFYNDDSVNALSDSYIAVYKRAEKYYVEQRYNGIYEITEKDFNTIKSYVKEWTDEIRLRTELSFTNYNKYDVYIKDNKLYAKNLKTNEEKVIFEKEPIKNIAIRPICCAANGNLLLLTTSGNVYMSEKDCNYDFSFDFPFKKLNGKDIVGFKLIPATEYDSVKNLYGVDSKGKEILLHKMN